MATTSLGIHIIVNGSTKASAANGQEK